MAELLPERSSKKLVQKRPDFDSVAKLYRWAEYALLGSLLRRTREHFIPFLAGAKRVLLLGDGDGRFLAKYLLCSPGTQAVAVDSSRQMLQLLQRRCRFARSRLEVRQADWADLPLDLELASFDLVVSHFALDCLSAEQLQRLAATLSSHLSPGARWIVSDFDIPPLQPWRTLGKLYIGGLYFLFGLLTGLQTRRLPEVQRSLERYAFRRLRRSEWLRGLLYSEVWELSDFRVAGSDPTRAQLPTHSGHPPS